MNIYDYALEKIQQGAKFYVNFENRTLKVGNELILSKGVYDERFDTFFPKDDMQFSEERLEELYDRYYNSVPSQRNDSRYKRYFLAKKESDMEDDDMMFGEPRELCQAALEMYLLFHFMQGTYRWNDENKWYWQSEIRPTFIILRQWVSIG